jgi:hypothetical protein
VSFGRCAISLRGQCQRGVQVRETKARAQPDSFQEFVEGIVMALGLGLKGEENKG